MGHQEVLVMNKQMHISVMFRVEQAAVNTQWTPDTTQEQDVVLDMSFDRKDPTTSEIIV